MKKSVLLYFLACILVLNPNLSWAFEWTSHGDDKSLYYLGVIFGQVGTVLGGVGNRLANDILSTFNFVVLSLGGIVAMYTAVTSTLTSAQEGEVMGKKWSSIYVPFRAAVGAGLLIPTTSGYSLVQIFMMWVAINSVHAANSIWRVVLDSAQQGVYINTQPRIDADALTASSLNAFYSTVCMEMLNSPQYNDRINGQQVSLYRYNDYEVAFGVEGNPGLARVCGGFRAAGYPPGISDIGQWTETQIMAAVEASRAMQGNAEEAALFNDPAQWVGEGVIATGRNAMRGPVGSVPVGGDKSADFTELVQNAKQDGWIFAGAYYFKLIRSGDVDNPTRRPPAWIPADNPPLDWNTILAKSNSYLTETDLGIGEEPREEIALGPTPNLRDSALSWWDDMSVNSWVKDILYLFLDHLTEREDDPLHSLQKVGSEIEVTTETLFYTVMGVSFVVFIIGCFTAATLPLCWTLGAILGILIPILTFMIGTMWSCAVLLGIYVPLIPYLVFMFTALGWLMLTVEAIVAAPIMTLGFISPGEDILGRASPGVLLITNVFLRPPLMIMGFIIASRLVVAVIGMINFAFKGTVMASLTGLGLMGALAIIIVYTGIIITAIHACFAIIYKLPDSIGRWLGGQVEQSQVDKAMQEAQRTQEDAASKSGEGMKFGAEFGKKQQAKAMSKSSAGGISNISM